jgi:hypothetical protein
MTYLNKRAYQLEYPCEDCSCSLRLIEGSNPPAFTIVHCPLHRIAPELLQSLKQVMADFMNGNFLVNIEHDEIPVSLAHIVNFVRDLTAIQTAIAKAEGHDYECSICRRWMPESEYRTHQHPCE